MSDLKMSCPACDGRVQFPEEGIGMTIDCPHCQAIVILCREEPLSIPVILPLDKKIEDEFTELSTTDGKVFGRFTKSLNGEYLLLWSDKWAAGESESKGPFYLFQRGQEVCKGKIERPNNGLVADNGNFIFCDWLFTQELQSVFYAFDFRGETIVKQKLDANLLNAGLSVDGMFAACQTATSDEALFSDTLLVFDLKTGAQIWHTVPPFRAENYEFNLQSMELTIRGTSPIYRACVLTLIPPPRKPKKIRPK